ncbi:MAG TPA: excinuclease ABC subunit UvrA [Candidatus Thermoplasmatota archaeon]|nr:excinuclease ABC subunit UvrA [Candidatus Thermoplasmatota archaeon]
MKDEIVIRGAREHNLKDIDVTLPRNRLVVVTGLSGSGKSSLAFDTLYAEGQRRYVESLSAYARQFLGQMEKPDCDSIEGLSPAISIDQKTTSKNPRSTVGTVTEIYDYLRVLFANLGVPHCPNDGAVIKRQTAQEIVDRVLENPEGAKVQVLAPVVRDRKGEYRKLLQELKHQGFQRVRVDGKLGDVDGEWKMGRYDKHSVDVVVDRVVVRRSGRATESPKGRSGASEAGREPDRSERGTSEDEVRALASRLNDSVEQALRLGEGLVIVNVDGKDATFSQNFGCSECGFSLPELHPRMFSFNGPHGACPACSGLGFNLEVDPASVVVDDMKSLNNGALHPIVGQASPWIYKELAHVAKAGAFDLRTPWKLLQKKQQDMVLLGTREPIRMKYSGKDGTVWWDGFDKFEGICNRLERYYKETESERKREKIQELMATRPCKDCRGARLKKEVLAITVGPGSKRKLDKPGSAGMSIHDVTRMPVELLHAWAERIEDEMDARERKIAHEVVKEIRERLRFMKDVGLDYLSLDRSSATLSGGEAQRIRLATQIGSGLVGVLYILDEPSIGLHQRDNRRLIQSLKGLRDLGNTLIVVEHDEEMIRSADWVLDLGPGAGEHGGRVVAEGPPDAILANPDSTTGRYLSGRDGIAVPARRRQRNGKALVVRGARENNLKAVDVEIPLGVNVCVTGVSGSGKSTLVNEILYKALARSLNGANVAAGAHDRIDGVEHLDKVIIIDQSPIGRTPRSNPATYTGVFTPIRELFASTPDAKVRGFEKGRFSFNVKGGRCEACEGDGVVQIEMHFLADVYVPCEVCKGARYNRETLAVRYNGKNVREVLDMSIDEGVAFFKDIPQVARALQTMQDVGLGYMRLGQSATTLSGGEAQRVKLATELQKRATGRTMYILDEPTTGLHFDDIKRLLGVLDRLVEGGNTVLIIEHNLDVIKTADWIVDLGPEGGEKGGRVVAEGTPEEVAKQADVSYTGQYLDLVLRYGHLPPVLDHEAKAVPVSVRSRGRKPQKP